MNRIMKFVLISRFFSYNFRKKNIFFEILLAITTNHFFTFNINISKKKVWMFSAESYPLSAR